MRKVVQALVLIMAFLAQNAIAQVVEKHQSDMVCGETRVMFKAIGSETYRPVLGGVAKNKNSEQLIVTIWFSSQINKIMVTHTKKQLTCIVTAADDAVFSPPGIRM